ncbi:MAG: polyamine aminopropyltransferase [bacterium]
MGFWLQDNLTPNVGLNIKIRNTLFKEKSPYQRIEVYDSYEFGRMMLLDGVIMFTERDEFFYHEILAHIPLFTHNNPKRVLVIGGGDGGVVQQVLQHPNIERIDLVEIDRMVIDVSKEFFPRMSQGLEDERVNIAIEDGSVFLLDKKEDYDVIIIDSTDPVQGKPSGNLYESDFFKRCSRALNDAGVMVSQVGSPLYSSDLIMTVFRDLKETFPIAKPFLGYVPTYSNGYYLFAFCSKKNDPADDTVLKRIEQSQMEGRYYNKDIHVSAFSLPNFIKEMVDTIE